MLKNKTTGLLWITLCTLCISLLSSSKVFAADAAFSYFSFTSDLSHSQYSNTFGTGFNTLVNGTPQSFTIGLKLGSGCSTSDYPSSVGFFIRKGDMPSGKANWYLFSFPTGLSDASYASTTFNFADALSSGTQTGTNYPLATSQNNYDISFGVDPNPSGLAIDNNHWAYTNVGGGTWPNNSCHLLLKDGSVNSDSSVAPSTLTRFISPISPTASSTVATSSPVSIGSHLYLNADQYVAGNTYLKMSFTNYTASLVTGSALQAWDTAFNNILVPITSTSSDISVSTSTSKFSLYVGKTEGSYQIITRDCPWYGFGYFCTDTVLAATSTYFYIGQKTSFDISQEAGNLGILGLAPGSDPFNATTTNSALDCNIAVSFDLNKCLFSFVVPNAYLANQVLSNFKSVPLLGWPIRFVEILVMTTATTSLPTINYTFSSHNSFLGGVNIHFDPWQYMYTSGSLVKDQFVSDQDGHSNVWDIFAPFVKLVVYLTLLFMVIRRLTGLNWGGSDYTVTETGSETISSSERLPDGSRKTFTHSVTKRRKL